MTDETAKEDEMTEEDQVMDSVINFLYRKSAQNMLDAMTDFLDETNRSEPLNKMSIELIRQFTPSQVVVLGSLLSATGILLLAKDKEFSAFCKQRGLPSLDDEKGESDENI